MQQIPRFFLLMLLFWACTSNSEHKIEEVSFIPKPTQLSKGEGSFSLSKKTPFYVSPQVQDLGAYFNEVSGLALEPQVLETEKRPEKALLFQLEASRTDLGAEGYSLSIRPEGISLTAGTPAGMFYGIQTMRQLLSGEGAQLPVSLPALEITDTPRFVWRGMMLDVGRHFMEKDFVKRYIDLLAYHKMNRLHLHLTEDQGWRIEIKRYPKLTEVGAWRTEPDGSRYGGFYTQDDLREIVAYAQSRYVTVVPEIDMPGHMQSALAAYPELACTEGPFEVSNRWGVHPDVLCAGKENVYEFVENVLDEVIPLFPGEYFHIGGDEVPKDRWEESAECQARIKSEGLKDEHELQSYFIRRVEQMLNKRDRRLIGWDEILEGDLLGVHADGTRSNATVQAWRSMDWAAQTVKQGNQAIVSPTSHCYLDYSIENIPLRKIYDFNPIPEGLTEAEAALILGGEAPVWTERIPQQRVDTMVFPRLLGLSEVLWTGGEKDWQDFHSRVQQHYSRLEALGVNYGPEDRIVYLLPRYDAASGQFRVGLEAGMQGLTFRYTLDGSEPDSNSPLYEDTLSIGQSAQMVVRAFRNGKPYGDLWRQKLEKHLATGKTPELKMPSSSAYPGTGPMNLVDGMRGSDKFRDGFWNGWEGEDMVAKIDLGAEETVSRIRAGFLQDMPSWVLLPSQVSFLVSTDDQTWDIVADLKPELSPQAGAATLYEFSQTLPEPRPVRYIRVIAQNFGTLPAWHLGAGGQAWVFCDEIVVE